MRQSPRNFDLARSRWTLHLLQTSCDAFAGLQTLSGVWRRLRGWRIRLRQGRLHLHSPDPDYAAKAEQVQSCLQDSAATVLFGDEMTFYRCPTPGRAYAKQGRGKDKAYRADLGHRSNTKRRLSGALDARTGQVHWRGGSKIGVKALCDSLHALRSAYPSATRLVLIWDNWPIHKHEKVLSAAQEAGIELVWLPTYAPWLNPIEKLWRKLKQEVLSLHRWGDDWKQVQEHVNTFLDQFNAVNAESQSLLAYVGLGKQTELPD